MHNGISPNLTGVIQLFNNGVDFPPIDDENLSAIAQRDGANVAGGGVASAAELASGANLGAGKNAASVAVERKKLVVDKDGKVLKPTKSPLIHPLNLSADEIEALEAFLRTL